MRNIDSHGRTSVGDAGFAAGKNLTTPGTSQAAGGANLTKPLATLSQSEGSGLNKGGSGLRNATEVHYNGRKTSLPSQVKTVR